MPFPPPYLDRGLTLVRFVGKGHLKDQNPIFYPIEGTFASKFRFFFHYRMDIIVEIQPPHGRSCGWESGNGFCQTPLRTCNPN